MTRILIARSGDRSVDEFFEHLKRKSEAVHFRRIVSYDGTILPDGSQVRCNANGLLSMCL